MSTKWVLPFCLVAGLWCLPVHAVTGDLSGVIESFVAKQFPNSHSHFWVVNGTQWQTDSEVVVDVNTVVIGHLGQRPSESRFLLLIAKGKLAASHRIPLDTATECQPDST